MLTQQKQGLSQHVCRTDSTQLLCWYVRLTIVYICTYTWQMARPYIYPGQGFKRSCYWRPVNRC